MAVAFRRHFVHCCCSCLRSRANVPSESRLLRTGVTFRCVTFTFQASDAFICPAPLWNCCSPCMLVISDERAELLRTASCVLYTPSLEHFGIVPVEAMCCGAPVVAVNSGKRKSSMNCASNNTISPRLCTETFNGRCFGSSFSVKDFYGVWYTVVVVDKAGREHKTLVPGCFLLVCVCVYQTRAKCRPHRLPMGRAARILSHRLKSTIIILEPAKTEGG